MKLKIERFRELSKREILEKALSKTKGFYRPFDPGQYLYNLLLDKTDSNEDVNYLFSEECLKLIYTTLIAWNMNGRGARLNEFDEFKNTIRNNKPRINSLRGYKIEELDESDLRYVLRNINILFKDLDLVGKTKNKKIKSKLVTFSKTMHFLLPELIVPIDRKYTLNFFYNTTQLDTDDNPDKNNEKQIKVFNELFEIFHAFSREHDFKKYIDKEWNRNIPKTIDNAVIGYMLLESETEKFKN